MGTWGTGLFSDDITADLRGDFRDLIGDGLSAEEATAKLVEEYRPESDPIDLEPPFWLALASVQWSLGRLIPLVHAKALELLDSGADLRRWEDDPKQQKKRAAVLEKLRETLTSPQPAPKKIPKRILEENDWPVGAVYRYRLPSGKYCLFLVCGHTHNKGNRYPNIAVLDWYSEQTPPAWCIHFLKRCQTTFRPETKARCQMLLFRTGLIEKGRLQDIGIKTWVRGWESAYIDRIPPRVLRRFLWKLVGGRSGFGWWVDSKTLDDFLERHCGYR